jgi:hypothetical protein
MTNDIEIARNYLRELADCDALWKKLTPAVAEAAGSEAAHFRRVMTGDPEYAFLLENNQEQNIWLRQFLTAGLTADLLIAWAAREQPIQEGPVSHD